MADPLTWLLKLDSDVGGATAFNRKLAETEARLAATDVASSKTEKALGDAAAKATRMGAAAAGAHHDGGEAAHDHEAKLRGLRDTLGKLKAPGEIHKLEQEIKNFGQHVPHATHGLGEFSSILRDATKVVGFKELSKAIDETKHSYIGLAEFAVGVVAFEGIKEGIELVSELGAEIMKAAAQEERMGKVFANNLGVEGGKEAQEYAEKYAQNTEFSREQTKGFATDLLRAGVPLEKLDMYMAAAGDIAAGSKNKIEGMSAAVAALSRATLTGKLEGRAMRGLSIGVPQMRELEEFRSKSDEELKGILSDGELTTNQVMRMIAGADGTVGDKAVDMNKTMAAQMAHIGELPDRYFEKFAESPAFDVMKGKLEQIIEGLDPNKEPGAKIFTSLESAVTGVVGGIASIDFVHVAESVSGFAKTLTELNWTEGARRLGVVVDGIAKVVGVISDSLQGAAMIAGAIAHPLDTAKNLGGAAIDVVSGHKERSRASWWMSQHTPLGAVSDAMDYLKAPSAEKQAARVWQNAETGEVLGTDAERAKKKAASDAAPASTEAMPSISGIVSEDPGEKALRVIGKYAPDFERKGIDAAAGFAAGMNRSDDPARAGAAMGMSALDGLASPAGQDSHSPSRKFARMGGYAGDGYAEGIEDSEERAVRAAAGMAAAAAGAGGPGDNDVSQPLFGRARAGATYGSDESAPVQRQPAPAPVERKIEINITVPVTFSGAPRSRESDETIGKLRAMLPGTLQAAVESLAIEEGR